MTHHNSHASLTPMDPAYPTCVRAVVNYMIYPEAETWQQISEILDIKPTNGHNKGEPSSLARRGRPIAPLTMWGLSSEYVVESMDLRDHLNWLLEQLAPRKDAVLQLQLSEGLSMVVWCNWWSKSGYGGPAVWPEQLRVMSDLNLTLRIDCSFFPGDD